MSNKEKIAVTGAAGNIGKFVVQGLLDKGCKVLAVVRKIETDEFWQQPGIEQRVAELSDADALTEAFEETKKVFSVTPLVENLVELGRITVEACLRAGVKKIVRSSALGADLNAPIMMGKWHGAVEKIIEDSGLQWTFVQPASFFQNYFGFAASIKNQNAFYAPTGTGKISLIDVRDIAAVVVESLLDDRHDSKKYAVTGGEALSNFDIAEIFSDVLGREIKFVDVEENLARGQMLEANMPEWMVNAVMELNQIGKAGYLSEILPSVSNVIGREPIKFRQFVEENKVSFE